MTDVVQIRLIIAGGRSFKDYDLLQAAVKDYLGHIHGNPINTEIVEGGAHGADRLGQQFARIHGYQTKRFQAEWGVYGKYAGPRRNTQMAQYATHCICFWDGISPGTRHMIEEARRVKLELEIVYY